MDTNRTEGGLFARGNNAREVYSLDTCLDIFDRMAQYALNDEHEALSVQEVILAFSNEIPYRTAYDQLRRFPAELQPLKAIIDAAIVARVNKGAIKGNYNATSSIWRCKQLGETDRQEIRTDNTTRVSMTPMQFVDTEEENQDD